MNFEDIDRSRKDTMEFINGELLKHLKQNNYQINNGNLLFLKQGFEFSIACLSARGTGGGYAFVRNRPAAWWN